MITALERYQRLVVPCCVDKCDEKPAADKHKLVIAKELNLL